MRFPSLAHLSATAALLLSLAAADPAVAAPIAGWNVSAQSNYGTSPLAPSVSDINVTVGGLTRGSGVVTSGTAAGRAWGGTNWNSANAAAAITANQFASCSVTPNAGFTVSFSSISKFDYRRSGSGATTGVVQYKVGSGAFVDIATVSYSVSASTGASLAAIDLSGISDLQNVPSGTAVTFRIVNYGGTATGGTWYVFDVANSTASDFELDGTVSNSGGDMTPPTVIALNPADNATSVPVSASPSITFNENVKKGTGSILIKRTIDNSTFETIPVTSSQVVVSGTGVTITPGSFFTNNTGYYLEIPAGAIEDNAGNDYPGISGTTAWNFTTLPASVAPNVTETFSTQTRVTPTGAGSTTEYYAEGNGQGTFALYGFGTFNFTKLDFGLSGASIITGVNTAEFTLTHNDRSFTQGTELEFFFTTDSSPGKTFNSALVNGIDNSQYAFVPVSLGKFPYTPKAGGQKDTFTLDLSGVSSALISRLNTGEDFSILLAATTPLAAITYSGKGNTFDPGDPQLKLTVAETTGADITPPTVAFFTPADGSGGLPIASNIKVAFNELIRKGASGAITIYRQADNSVFEAINVTSSQVTVNLGTVTIDPTASLESAGNYYVQISAGAIEDVSGNDFGGISDLTTWNFSTAQPPITATGPFAISQNAPAGTVVGVLNSNINGKEGIKYAIIGGSGGSTQMKCVPGSGYLVSPIFTIGDTIESTTGALNSTSAGNFSVPGTLDGLGAYALDPSTIRVFMNHEIEIPSNGSGAFPYTLANGTVISKGGARVSFIDIDKVSRRVVNGGLAISRVYARNGVEVTNASQLELNGFDRMCSSSLFEPNLWGAGRGLVNRLYINGEETSTGFGHPHGGTFWALDPSNGDFWALPDLGRGSWENAALVDTGTTTHVAFLLGDDTQGVPLYLYVGAKSTAPGANFVERNGLKGGQLYVWKSTNGDTTPTQFRGTGSTRNGTWVAINARNNALAGTTGYDALGYKNDTTLENEADSLGAFSFSRPEDLSTSPTDGSIVAFTSTGRGNLYPLDNWGDTYVVDLDFTNLNAPTASIRILYDGDDAGNGQFASPEEGLRCPDNLDWADDGSIYVQEDQSNQQGSFGAAGFETSIWRLDASTGQATRVAMTDRSTVLPLGSADGNVSDYGNWESSGIIDVSSLFGETAGTLFLFDIQAHSITNGLISAKTLYEGGQLCFLERGTEKGAFKVNPNTGVITLANPDFIDLASHPSFELRLQAYDGTNSTLEQVTINVNNSPSTSSNTFKVASFNTSHYRASSGALITDLASVTATQSQSIARIIQRNNPDVILLNEFDYDAGGVSVRRFQENYLEVGQSGESPVYYPYAFIAPSNTGIPSGKDLDNNGSIVSTPGATGFGEDALGFGVFAGQYAFVVLSKFPIDTANVRTFQKFLWKDMPGALLPDNPNVAGTGDWYSTDELAVVRLSSKNHADVPVLVNGARVHVLASHPTPPVFDSPGSGLPWVAGVDHNGRRNSDEIRFWSDYVNPANSSYIYDDTETTATASGGLAANSRFVICGDQNADNNEGDSTDPAIKTLIGGGIVVANPLVNSSFTPAGGTGPDPDDTAAFSGGVRVDYVLPSAYGLKVESSGVFWPGAGDPITGALSATDHHLVHVTMTLEGSDLPGSNDVATYYVNAQGLTGAALQNALRGIITGHAVIDYNLVDELMKSLDQSSTDNTQVRLIYSNATLPKTAMNTAGGWNREHVWPRSDGVGEDGADFADLHHLFPCQEGVNSLRGNLPFDESSNVTSDPFAPESFADANSFEPLDRDKGIVARALLYMMTRYDGSEGLTSDLILADNTSPTGTHGVLTTLLTWNRNFPPSDYERARNNAIYAGIQLNGATYAQGNRNPFIDFPQFADAIFLGSSTLSFEKWQLRKFTFAQLLNPAVSGRTVDADNDGFSNEEEFLFDGNPLSSGDIPLSLVRTATPQQFLLTFRLAKGLRSRAAVRSSTNISSWTSDTNWQANSVFTDLGDSEKVEYSVTVPVGETRWFFDVLVNLN